MNEQIVKVLEILNEKYKLGLNIDGNKVRHRDRLLTPFQVKDLYDQYFPRARDEFINELFIKSINEAKISNEPPQNDLPQGFQPELF